MSLLKAGAKKRDCRYWPPSHLTTLKSRWDPPVVYLGCARSEHGTVQRACCLCQLTSGSPSACSSSTTPFCPGTNQLPNSSTRRCSHTARTSSPGSPCACWSSTSLSCPQTTPLPNSNTQPRSRTARTVGPAEAGPQELAVEGAA